MAGDSQRLARVGRVSKAHGIRGEVMVRPDDPESTTLLSQKAAFLKAPDREVELVPIESVRTAHEAWLVRFEGCDDRTTAEAYVGREVLLPRESLPQLDEGEFYAEDLVGLQVTSTSGEVLGKVVEVIDAGGVPVLEIQGQRRFQVPLADTFVKAIDLKAGVVQLDPPVEGDEVEEEKEEGGG
ncbi:MAG TPA: ribosome maturation factor RimM [Myxococcales bacterium]|jgi:16S rRNA processing protein RimM